MSPCERLTILIEHDPSSKEDVKGLFMENQMQITKSQETRLVTMFEEFWGVLPKGNKLAKGNARTAWLRLFKKVEEAEWNQLYNDIKEGLIAQESYRKRLLREYPDERAQKAANVFVPSRPHPATWLNGERWKDDVKDIENQVSKSYAPKQCMDCEDEGTVLVKINDELRPLCAWHWTKRFDRNHLELLYEQLKKDGLGKKKSETKEEWSLRCRKSMKGTKWGDALGA